MSRKPLVFALAGVSLLALSGLASAQRVSSTQKGSLLIFSKIEIKWDAQGNLIQDTFLDITNDYPADVSVQGYFINGDIELEEICSGDPCEDNIIQAYEPGWNTADCRFEMTANQPHFWSAANGSNKCQQFTVLDGDGRPDPESGMINRVLRGYAIFFATAFQADPEPGIWLPIRWNHLKGDAVIVNYADGSAWEYNAWAFQSNAPVENGMRIGAPDMLLLDGGMYDVPFATLLLDFYATGSTALSGGGVDVMVNTDVTLHAVSADLRQDGCGPVLTKVEAEIWNEFETKFSGTRRCICCWDQTMLSDWVRSVAIPNHFLRSTLRTDKGKARLDGVESVECDYEELCGPTAMSKRWLGCVDEVAGAPTQSENAAILGLATKFLSFSTGAKATAGMNLVGMGVEPAVIELDPMSGPDELQGGTRASRASEKTSGATSDRNATIRGTVEVPAE